MKIPFKRLNFEAAKPEIDKLLKSGFIGLGKSVFDFEQKFAEYVGSKYAIATDSCTSALFISLKYFKANGKYKHYISRNFEDIFPIEIPSMTVPLVGNAVIESGLNLFFNDDCEWVGSAYTLVGSNVIDSAHQLNRDICKGLPECNYCFSFYPTKPIGSADGGMIATNDPEFAEWARSVITYGRNQTQQYKNSWEYETERLGYKRHYTNLQAVICMEQLQRMDETNELRAKIRDKFNDAFDVKNESLYLFRLDVKRRNEFIEHLKEEGIECGVHFKPLHQMKAFRDFEFEPDSDHKIVDMHYDQTVSIPMYETLTEAEQDYIIRKVKYWGEKN